MYHIELGLRMALDMTESQTYARNTVIRVFLEIILTCFTSLVKCNHVYDFLAITILTMHLVS